MNENLLFDITQEDERFRKVLREALKTELENPDEVLRKLSEESKQKQRDIFDKHYPKH